MLDRYHATGAPSLHMYTHIFSVSQHIALVGGICDYSGNEEVWRDPMLMQDEPMRDQAIDFPYTAVILVHDCVFNFLGFSFFSSGVTAYFPFLGKVGRCVEAGEELDEAVLRPLVVGWGTWPNPFMGGRESGMF